MHVLHVVGARPNFMKAAPVYRALQSGGVVQTLLHTGQHYDTRMSEVFFRDLDIPEPDDNLNVGSGSHAQQTAAVMSRFEPVLLARNPDVVLVYGDVNSTVAASLVCSKLGVRVGHVEAGLRSGDRTMPEEINRLVTDQLSDLLFAPSSDGVDNLLREGIAEEKIFFVGNVMIDTLIRLLPSAEKAFDKLRVQLSLDEFGLVTLHRPSNVDDGAIFLPMLAVLNDLSRDLPLVFPVHPRTRQKWAAELAACDPGLRVINPLGYIDFLALQNSARIIVTDSGGVQEESTWLGIPCLTLRENTERPVTITMGTNTLVGRNWKLVRERFHAVLATAPLHKDPPPLWDGHAAERIADVLAESRI